jgi:hypothetical protein
MDSDTGLTVACGLLLAGTLQHIAKRTANGIEREFSLRVDSLQYGLRESGHSAAITAKLVLGVSLGVHLLVRRRQGGRTSPRAVR